MRFSFKANLNRVFVKFYLSSRNVWSDWGFGAFSGWRHGWGSCPGKQRASPEACEVPAIFRRKKMHQQPKKMWASVRLYCGFRALASLRARKTSGLRPALRHLAGRSGCCWGKDKTRGATALSSSM